MMADRTEIAKLILEAEELYPSKKPLSDGALAAYVDDLADCSLDEIKFAIKQHRRASKWFPTISELLDIVPRFVYSNETDNKWAEWTALMEERQTLMDGYYAGEVVDIEGLARKFDRAGRPDGAAALRAYVQ